MLVRLLPERPGVGNFKAIPAWCRASLATCFMVQGGRETFCVLGVRRPAARKFMECTEWLE